jgi:hypothetical protein
MATLALALSLFLTFHSLNGPLAQARALYLSHCNSAPKAGHNSGGQAWNFKKIRHGFSKQAAVPNAEIEFAIECLELIRQDPDRFTADFEV